MLVAVQSVLVAVQVEECIDEAPYIDTYNDTSQTVQTVQMFHVKLLYSNNTTVHPGLLSVCRIGLKCH